MSAPAFSGLPDNIPALDELKRIPQWVAWKYEDRGGAKPTKPPIAPHIGRYASTDNPGTWGTYEQAARRAIDDGLPGVGFVLTQDDGYLGFDLDHCITHSGKVKPWAQEILDLRETWAETSPSKKGIRLIGRGKIAAATTCDPAGVEIYDEGRYLTITGRHLDGSPDTIASAPKTKAACVARAKLHSETWAALGKCADLNKPVWAELVNAWPKLRPGKGKAPPAPAPKPGGIIEQSTGGKVLEFNNAPMQRGAIRNALQSERNEFWRKVNSAALDRLSAWVPDLFGAAAEVRQGAVGGYRVSSAALGRNLEEDIGITSKGIKDFGVRDMGDANEGKRTPIDLVVEHGTPDGPVEAAHWLCERMGVTPESLGWRGNEGAQSNSSTQTDLETRRPELLSSAAFIKNFVPPDYLIDGVLQRRYCYSLTAPTGTGKTSLLLYIISRVAQGLPVGTCGTECGAICFLAGENPDDVRSRWMALAEQTGFDIETIPVYFIEGVFPLAEIKGGVAQRAQEIGVEFSMVVVDTSAAYDLGDDENSNAQMKKHARMLRSLVELPGGPTVVAACHPAKNADPDNLLPRGGGAFVAEVDGNLVCKKSSDVVEMHWQGKFRGVDFNPIPFQIEVVTADKLRDGKGRLIPTVVAKAISEAEHGAIVKRARSEEDDMILLLKEEGDHSISQMAEKLNWSLKTGKSYGEPHKTKVVRVLERLRHEGLAKRERGRHVLTEKGSTLAKKLA
jgi:hypothetical protein